MFINEESIEEDQSERSLINEDKERRGEQLSSQNVSPRFFGQVTSALKTRCTSKYLRLLEVPL